MKNYFTNPLFCLFAGIGLNRVAGFSPLYSALQASRHSIQLFSVKRPKEFPSAFADDGIKPLKRRSIKSFQPKTENQKEFVDLMRNDAVDIVIAIGPAGTGKTMLACYSAVEALRLGKVNKLVVTRPVVSVDEELGFLPGSLESKMDPWTRPIFDTFRETYSAKEIDKMTEEGIIEIVPLGFMRGRTFKNTWIIADEMQNSSPTQMFMLATRIGEGSKMIITGDLNQSDLNPKSNGLLEIFGKIRAFDKRVGLDCVRYVELDTEDVQRSRAAKTILNIYDPVLPNLPEEENPEEENPEEESEPLELDAYENDSRFTDEFEYLNLSTSTNQLPNFEEKKDEPVQSSVDCFRTPKEWVNIDNDAALIPIHHISKYHSGRIR